MDSMLEEEFSMYKFLFESEEEQSSSDEEEITAIVLSVLRMERNAIKLYYEVTVPLYSDEEFKRHFRASKTLMNSMADRYSTSRVFLKHLHGEFDNS